MSLILFYIIVTIFLAVMLIKEANSHYQRERNSSDWNTQAGTYSPVIMIGKLSPCMQAKKRHRLYYLNSLPYRNMATYLET